MAAESAFTDWNRVPLVLNVTQVADLLGVSRPTVYALIRDEKLPARRFRSRRLVTKSALLEFLGEREVGDGNGGPASSADPPSSS